MLLAFEEVVWRNFLTIHAAALGVIIVVLVLFLPNGLLSLVRDQRMSRRRSAAMTALLDLDQNVSRRFGGLNAVERRQFHGRRRRDRRADRPEWRRKNHAHQLDHRRASGDRRHACIFDGRDITRLRPHQIARLGLARTFQIVQPFPKMTVLENVAAGALFAGTRDICRDARAQAREHLTFTGLPNAADKPAATLTLAQRKRLELAKGLAMKPRLLMLDEVNAGLNPTEIDEALAMIRKIAERGITIVVIEHLMKVVLSISQRIAVLHHGQLIADGTRSDVLRDPA